MIMKITRVLLMPASLGLFLLSSSVWAGTPSITIDQRSDTNITTCAGTVNLVAAAPADEGYHTYYWTLWQNNRTSVIATATEVVNNEPYSPLEKVWFAHTISTMNGTYSYQVEVRREDNNTAFGEFSKVINVTKVLGTPIAMSQINGDTTVNSVPVCPGGPIILDASLSSCALHHYASIQLSNQWWTGMSPAFGRWLSDGDYQKYGPISHFDMKRFAVDNYFGFVPGQYYRVTSAVDPVWNAHTQLISVQAPVSVLKINGTQMQTLGPTLNIDPDPHTGVPGPILMNGSASTCASSYFFLSVQLSDSAWNGAGPEAMRWLTQSDFNTYGPISHFDVKKFAESQGFVFSPGQYYRVKLAVGPGWTDTTGLIHIFMGERPM